MNKGAHTDCCNDFISYACSTHAWPLWGHSGIVIASELELCRLYRILHQSRVAPIYMHSMWLRVCCIYIRLAMLTYQYAILLVSGPLCFSTSLASNWSKTELVLGQRDGGWWIHHPGVHQELDHLWWQRPRHCGAFVNFEGNMITTFLGCISVTKERYQIRMFEISSRSFLYIS